MKGENIKPDDSHDTVDVGANLSFRPAENSIKQLEFNYSDSGEESMGTFEWREFEHDFQTDSDGKIKITCRLGNWWNEVTGKIYIDNVSIEKNDSLKTHVGRNIRTDFEKTDLEVISDENMSRWLGHLDYAYDKYVELVGKKPFDGRQMKILSAKTGDYIACAGNPINFVQQYVKGDLTNINNDDNWSFAMLHEIGHNFDYDNWNFDGEFWANFKMYYVMSQSVTDNNPAITSKGETDFYIGDQIRNLYAVDSSGCYENTIKDRKGYHNDGLTHCFIRIVDKIGWEPFKKTFREFLDNNINPSTNIGKFDKFLELLQKNYKPGSNEVKQTFPDGELEYIRDHINE